MRKTVLTTAFLVGALALAGCTSSGGEAVPNETVPSEVSTVPADVPVPSLVGLAVADAQYQIAAGNLIAQVQPECSSTIPNGVVISANPPEGTTLPKGSNVSIRVSLGPCPG